MKQQFKTGFLNWQWIGCLWSAVDPVNRDMRWIIRRPALVTVPAQWEAGHVFSGGSFYPIACGDNPEFLGYRAVVKRLEQVTYQLEVMPEMIKKEHKSNILRLLETLNGAFDDQLAQGSEHGSSDVDEEGRQPNCRSSAD